MDEWRKYWINAWMKIRSTFNEGMNKEHIERMHLWIKYWMNACMKKILNECINKENIEWMYK